MFVAGMGTGGTISGTECYLKKKNPGLIVVGADPEGSILSGDSPKPFKVEGIGEDLIPRTFDRQIVDEMVRVSDKESFNTARQLARQEGILAGGSSGTALAAVLKYAEHLKRPHTFVVILPDTGRNYLSTIFSDDWMQEHGFWDCWLMLRGLKTLAVRMREHAENALHIARELVAHPAVSQVYYPGLPSHPQHDLACRQMSGFSGMISIERAGGRRSSGSRLESSIAMTCWKISGRPCDRAVLESFLAFSSMWVCECVGRKHSQNHTLTRSHTSPY